MYLTCPSCGHKINNIGASVASVNCVSCGYPVHSHLRDYFSQLKPYKHFRNDVLVEEGFYKNSKKEFMWKTYHSNGQVAQMGGYKDGIEEAEWKSFYDNGELENIGFYVNGNKHGDWRHYFHNGDLLSTEIYENGKLLDFRLSKY